MLILAAALLLQATDAPPPPALQAKIKRHFDADLLDGPSARWKWPAMRKSAKGLYCGWVNAKNKLGAYTGWKPFYVFEVNGKVDGEIDDGQSSTAIMLDVLCTQKGYDITEPPRD